MVVVVVEVGLGSSSPPLGSGRASLGLGSGPGSGVVGVADGTVRVHWRFCFLIKGFGMRLGLGGRF